MNTTDTDSIIPVAAEGRAFRAESHTDDEYFGGIMCGDYSLKGDMYNPDFRIGRLVNVMMKKEMRKVFQRRGQDMPIGVLARVELMNTSLSYIPDTTLMRIAKRLDVDTNTDIFTVKRAMYKYTL